MFSYCYCHKYIIFYYFLLTENNSLLHLTKAYYSCFNYQTTKFGNQAKIPLLRSINLQNFKQIEQKISKIFALLCPTYGDGGS